MKVAPASTRNSGFNSNMTTLYFYFFLQAHIFLSLGGTFQTWNFLSTESSELLWLSHSSSLIGFPQHLFNQAGNEFHLEIKALNRAAVNAGETS